MRELNVSDMAGQPGLQPEIGGKGKGGSKEGNLGMHGLTEPVGDKKMAVFQVFTENKQISTQLSRLK